MMKVSIVVPVYNVSNYLRAFWSYVQKQTFRDFEVVFIDDGSTDDSGSILEDIRANNNKVSVYHKANGGISSARNMGIEMAKGEWVAFLDPDDRISPQFIEKLVLMTSDQVDMVECGYTVVDTQGEKLWTSKYEGNGVISSEKALRWIFHPQYYWGGYAWNKLYRLDVLKRNKVLFDTSLKNNEDGEMNVRYLCVTKKKVAYTTDALYFYTQGRPNSITSNSLKDMNKYHSEFLGVIKMCRTVKQARRSFLTVFLAERYAYIVYKRHYKKMKNLGNNDVLISMGQEINEVVGKMAKMFCFLESIIKLGKL